MSHSGSPPQSDAKKHHRPSVSALDRAASMMDRNDYTALYRRLDAMVAHQARQDEAIALMDRQRREVDEYVRAEFQQLNERVDAIVANRPELFEEHNDACQSHQASSTDLACSIETVCARTEDTRRDMKNKTYALNNRLKVVEAAIGIERHSRANDGGRTCLPGNATPFPAHGNATPFHARGNATPFHGSRTPLHHRRTPTPEPQTTQEACTQSLQKDRKSCELGKEPRKDALDPSEHGQMPKESVAPHNPSEPTKQEPQSPPEKFTLAMSSDMMIDLTNDEEEMPASTREKFYKARSNSIRESSMSAPSLTNAESASEKTQSLADVASPSHERHADTMQSTPSTALPPPLLSSFTPLNNKSNARKRPFDQRALPLEERSMSVHQRLNHNEARYRSNRRNAQTFSSSSHDGPHGSHKDARR